MHRRRWSRARWILVIAIVTIATASIVAALHRPDATAARDEPAPMPTVAAPAGIGRAAGSQVATHRPDAVRLPSGVAMPVDSVATGDDGVLELPTDIGRAGWWDGGSRIGDPFGTIVLAAHVDSLTDGIGPFAELLRARTGQRLRVTGAGSVQQFEIVSVRLTPRASLSQESSIFSVRGPLRLVLITCAGPFDAARGGYRDNLIVTASAVGRPRTGGG